MRKAVTGAGNRPPKSPMDIKKICKLDCTKVVNREALFDRAKKVCRSKKFDLCKTLEGVRILQRKTGIGAVVCTSFPGEDRIIYTASLHDVPKDKVVCTAIALDFNELAAKVLLALLEIKKKQ